MFHAVCTIVTISGPILLYNIFYGLIILFIVTQYIVNQLWRSMVSIASNKQLYLLTNIPM